MTDEVWHAIGLLPLLAAYVRKPPEPYRLIAWGLAVSFFADTAVHFGASPLVVSIVYPVTQAFVIALALDDTAGNVLALLAALVSAGLAAAGLYDPAAPLPDVLLSTVAFGSVAGLAWMTLRPSVLQTALVVYFLAGLIAWWAFAWTAYTRQAQDAMTAYQWSRAVGIALFCLALAKPAPRLRPA